MKKKFLAVLFAATMIISSAIPTYAADTTTGLIAKFEFDENLTNEVTGTDAKVINKCGLGADAPAADYTMPFVDGVSGKALELGKGTSEHGLNLNVAPADGLTYTVSLWVKANDCKFANAIVWIGRTNQGSGENWHGLWPGLVDNYQNGVAAGCNAGTVGGSLSRVPATPNANEGLGFTKNERYDEADKVNSTKKFDWTMVTMVVEKGSCRLYYDGQLVGRTGEDSLFCDLYADGDTTVSTYLGANYWDAPIIGYVDSLYMYDRALTGEDVKALFDQTHGDIPAGQFNAIKETTTQKPSTGIPDGVTVTVKKGVNPVVIGGAIAAGVAVVIVAVVVVVSSKKKKANVDEDEE